MSTRKIVILTIVGIILIPIAVISYNLVMTRIFKPAYENVDRQVFENTKSYTYGKVQELAKYYAEYQKASYEDKRTIKKLIVINFANFDADKIQSPTLRRFLIIQRGF